MSTPEDLPRVRALALGAVVLVVTAAGAVHGATRVPVLVAVAVALAAAGAWRWHRAGRTGIATSAVVAAVLVGVLLVEETTLDVDTVLRTTAAIMLVAGWVLRERRLVVSGLLTLAVLLGRPLADGQTFSHCLVVPELALPAPRLDGPLLLALAATVAGTAMRWTGWADRPGVARGAEATGAIGLVVLLWAKAMELPGHRLLCGSGEAIDPGWVVVGLAFGILGGLYGLATRDVVWEGVGLASVTGQGVLATTLTGDVWWAVGGAVLLVAALAVAERLGVPWPDDPGYGHARPSAGRLLARARRLRGTDVPGRRPPPADGSRGEDRT